MVRDEPLDWPTPDEAATAGEVALDRDVLAATPIEEGLNATYRLELADGERAVLKAATLATDAELWPEPHLEARVGRETAVPVPGVLAAVAPEGSPLGVAYFLTEHCEGRHETDVLALSPAAHERLVREAGTYLAELHDLSIADGFGNLRVEDGNETLRVENVNETPGVEGGDFVVGSPRESWSAWFGELTTDVTAGLEGEGFTNDDAARFADLAPAVGEALGDCRSVLVERDVAPAVLHGDLRPANLVFTPADDADPLVRAVLDFGDCQTGDGLLDLALAEDALIDVPLGGTVRADRLRTVLRNAYVDRRTSAGTDLADRFDAEYPYYRLYARARSLAAFDFWVQFAREDDPDAAARRWRSFVEERLANLG